MKKGDICELTKDITCYRKGKRAHFIRTDSMNQNNAEIVWFGEEQTYNLFGDVEIVPKKIIKKIN